MRKAILFAAVLALAGSLWAADPLTGKWKRNKAKSKVSPEFLALSKAVAPKESTLGPIVRRGQKAEGCGIGAPAVCGGIVGISCHFSYEPTHPDAPVTSDKSALCKLRGKNCAFIEFGGILT